MTIQCSSKAVLTSYLKWALTVFAMFYSGFALSQSDKADSVKGENNAGSAFVALYQNYSNAGYAVRWAGDSSYFSLVREKISRYEYLVLYSSLQMLEQSEKATIQFGFFKTESEAKEFVTANNKAFPGLSVVSVSAQEHQALFAASAENKDSQSPNQYFWLRPNTHQGLTSFQVMLAKAKGYYINKQYALALKYYAVLSLAQDADTAVSAIELMAVCYERLGQTNQAAQMYRSILSRYPEAKATQRVTQRLRAIETAESDDKSPLRSSTLRKNSDKAYWRGMLGQSYNLATRGGPTLEDQDVLNALVTHFDFHAGRDFDGHKFDLRLNGYDLYDMLDTKDDPNHTSDSKTAIKRFYVKYNNKDLGLNILGGRQKDYDSGVYTSFDGASLRYSPSDKWTLGLSAGTPVYFSDFADYIDREFYSVFAAYQPTDHWSVSTYFTEQTFFGETERSAVGGKVSYVGQSFYSSLSLDYDLEFAELNLARWSVSYQASTKSQWSATYGYQRTPFLSASNIQVGQPYLNVENYIKRSEYDYQTLLDEAFARTSLYEYGSLSYKYRLDEDLQLMMDVYHSLSTNNVTFASDDDGETFDIIGDGKYFEYTSGGIQAVINNLISKQDTAILSFRHFATTLASGNSIQVSERLRLGKRVFIKPSIMLRNTKRKDEESGQTRVRGSLSLAFKPTRTAELRAEVGNEVIEDLDEKTTIDSTYFIIGYQARF